MKNDFIRIDDMELPIILNKKTSTMEIVKETKNIVLDDKKFHSFMRTIQRNNPNKYKKNNDYRLPDMNMSKFSSKINFTMNLSKNMTLKTESDCFLTETNVSSVKSQKIKKFIFNNKENIMIDDYFGTFYDFLNIDGFGACDYKVRTCNSENYFLKNIEIIKNELYGTTVLSKIFNPGEKNETNLKIKSFSFRLSVGKIRSKVYLPFDFITIFGFCTNDQVIFILSQCIEFDEGKNIISLNDKKIKSILNTLPYFDTENHKIDFSNKFKFNKNIQFEWITDTNRYCATLSCPKICFNIVNRSVCIFKHLPIEMFLNILPNDFEKWDISILSYLRSDKEFRKAFNKIQCNNLSYLYRMKKTSINIDRSFNNEIDELSLDISIISLVYQNNKELNNFITIQGYTVELNRITKVIHNLSWRNTLTLLKLKKFVNLENFINRKTHLDKEGKINFDRASVEYINNELADFFPSKLEDNDPKPHFHLLEPRVNFQTVINGRYNKQKIIIPQEYTEDIEQLTGIKQIVEYFCKNLKNVVTLMILEDSKIKF